MKFPTLIFSLEFAVATPVLFWFYLITYIRLVKNIISILIEIILKFQITSSY